MIESQRHYVTTRAASNAMLHWWYIITCFSPVLIDCCVFSYIISFLYFCQKSGPLPVRGGATPDPHPTPLATGLLCLTRLTAWFPHFNTSETSWARNVAYLVYKNRMVTIHDFARPMTYTVCTRMVHVGSDVDLTRARRWFAPEWLHKSYRHYLLISMEAFLKD